MLKKENINVEKQLNSFIIKRDHNIKICADIDALVLKLRESDIEISKLSKEENNWQLKS